MRQGTVTTIKPEVAALSVAKAKRQLRIEQDYTADDEHIGDLCRAAERMVENMLGLPIMEQTRETHLSAFPCGGIWLSAGNDLQITELRYYDVAGADILLDPSKYVVDAVSRPARIYAAPNATWPSTQSRPGAVRVTWTSGWEKEADVPEDLIHAMKLLVAHWDQNREAVVIGSITNEIELAVEDLIRPFRIPFVA